MIEHEIHLLKMESYNWTSKDIEIFLNASKDLLSPPRNEDIEKYELLRMNLTFLKYLQSIMIKQKENNVPSVLNAIILRMSQLDYCRNSSINVIN